MQPVQQYLTVDHCQYQVFWIYFLLGNRAFLRCWWTHPCSHQFLQMEAIFRDQANRGMNYSCMHFEFDRMLLYLANSYPGHIHIFVSNSETYLTFRLVIGVFWHRYTYGHMQAERVCGPMINAYMHEVTVAQSTV